MAGLSHEFAYAMSTIQVSHIPYNGKLPHIFTLDSNVAPEYLSSGPVIDVIP